MSFLHLVVDLGALLEHPAKTTTVAPRHWHDENIALDLDAS